MEPSGVLEILDANDFRMLLMGMSGNESIWVLAKNLLQFDCPHHASKSRQRRKGLREISLSELRNDFVKLQTYPKVKLIFLQNHLPKISFVEPNERCNMCFFIILSLYRFVITTFAFFHVPLCIFCLFIVLPPIYLFVSWFVDSKVPMTCCWMIYLFIVHHYVWSIIYLTYIYM